MMMETGRPMAANGTVLVLFASILVAGFECLLTAAYIADPASPAGDRAVVVERNAPGGLRDVYLVSGGWGGSRSPATAPTRLQPHGQRDLRVDGAAEPHFSIGTPANPVVMYPAD
ncbi:MAG: hypothetical protein ACLT98_06995 [Eggerthellaceae bacterium]